MKFTNDRKREVVDYADEHGVVAACKKYDIIPARLEEFREAIKGPRRSRVIEASIPPMLEAEGLRAELNRAQAEIERLRNQLERGDAERQKLVDILSKAMHKFRE